MHLQRHPELRSLLEQLTLASRERARAVEQFKTNNSVLKNSVYYLPLAAHELSYELRDHADSSDERHATGPAIQGIATLVQATLTQNLLGGMNCPDRRG